eukprot:290335-Alexandrium_andersonii.AAC.1
MVRIDELGAKPFSLGPKSRKLLPGVDDQSFSAPAPENTVHFTATTWAVFDAPCAQPLGLNREGGQAD